MTTALEILKTKKERKSAWVEFQQGISFQVNYLSRGKLKRITENSTSFAYNPRTRAREPKMNNDFFNDTFIRETVVGWKGVTARSLSNLIDIDISEIPESKLDDPLDYDHNAMVVLFDEAYDLDQVLQDFVLDIKNFQPDIEDELGNSETSPDGN